MAVTLDTMPADQRTMLTLLQDHAWHSQHMGMLDWDQYRERFVWLHANMDRPMPDSEPADFAWQYRWKAIPVKNSHGLVSDVLVAFRDPADRTMFVLRWS